MIKIKRIITALLNNQVNIELTKEENIQVIEKDLLYQDAVIETIESNENIDYLLLNENLPGENLNEFINKIEKLQPIKIILFVDKIKKEQNQFQTQIYKIYENGEVTLEEIKKIIKEENYTYELEQEIRNLKRIIEEKNKEKEKSILNKLIKIEKEKEYQKQGKVISIAGFGSFFKTRFIIDLINGIKNKQVILINMDILDYEKEDILKTALKDNIKIERASKILFHNNKTITKDELAKKINQYKKQYDYIIVNNSAECFFELNKSILNEADKILFVIEKNIKDIKISNNLLKIYENNWKVDTTKIDIVLNNIKNPKDIEIIPYERKEVKMQERKIKIYKKILKIKGE